MNLMIHIEHMVLEGMDAADADRVRTAIVQAIEARLRADPALATRARGRDIHFEGGRFEVKGAHTPETIGQQVADQLMYTASPQTVTPGDTE